MKLIKTINNRLGALKVELVEAGDSELTLNAISDLLVSCASDLAESKGGHVPDDIVKNRILKYYTTVESVKSLFLVETSRFIVTMNSDIVATVLVANKPGLLLPEISHGAHENFKSRINDLSSGKHSVFNIAVNKSFRKIGLARFMLAIVGEYFYKLGAGNGFYLRSEPSEHDIWIKMGFIHLPQLDEYFEDPIKTKKWSSPQLFNSHYQCNCKNTVNQNIADKKVKYFGFVNSFALFN